MWQLGRFTKASKKQEGKFVWVQVGPPTLMNIRPLNSHDIITETAYSSHVISPLPRDKETTLAIPKSNLELLGEFKEEVDLILWEQWNKEHAVVK